MNLQKNMAALALTALVSSPALATTIDFASSADDTCGLASGTYGSTLTGLTEGTCTSATAGSWVSAFDSAIWIQNSTSWGAGESSDSYWYVKEEDLGVGYDLNVELEVAFDDFLTIWGWDANSNSATMKWNSNPGGTDWSDASSQDWGSTQHVAFGLGADEELIFVVKNRFKDNTNGGPTGVIYSGTASVPEPGSLALLGLGLAGLGLSRRKKR